MIAGARAALILFTFGLASAGCINTSSVLPSDDDATVDPAKLEADAKASFDTRPRDETAVRDALEAMRTAARSTAIDDPARADRVRLAARYAVWIARHAASSDARADAAGEGITLANTAVEAEPERVDGYYFRAVAVGCLARENSLYGADAMTQIRGDATRAVELDAAFESAGPHRVLGGLYLRAPGPPAGVGSVRRAVRELEKAVELAPDHPGNLLFLAEAYAASARTRDRVPPLLEQAEAALRSAGNDPAIDPVELAEWQAHLDELTDANP